ncbi:MAG: hypothetical protein KBD42_07340 [Chitinophagales bacterium]|nr:hypothetical protein [Chitinophagales bacterium]MBP9795835.1 hypothetical protein [Chitinophagales bacterium]
MKLRLVMALFFFATNFVIGFCQNQDTLLKYQDYVSLVDKSKFEIIIKCDSANLIGWTFKEIDDTICVNYSINPETKEISKIEMIGHGTAQSYSTYYFRGHKLIMIRELMYSCGIKNWDSYIYFYNDEEFHQDYFGSELNGKAFVKGAYELLNFYK